MTTIAFSRSADYIVDHAQFLSVTQKEIVWITCTETEAQEVHDVLAPQSDDWQNYSVGSEGATLVEYWGSAESNDPADNHEEHDWRIHVRVKTKE